MRFKFLIALTLAMTGYFFPVHGQDASGKLRVGVFDQPPFAMKDETGQWSGLAVGLWEEISRELNLSFEYQFIPLDQMIPALQKGEIDVAVGGIAVSADRGKAVDLTQTYLASFGAVAVAKKNFFPGLLEFLSDFAKHGLITSLLVTFGTLTMFSLLLWLAERGANEHHFGGEPLRGFGSALWFSAVTMTTVGYGDKIPKSMLGRVLSFFWMFFGILIVSAFTGAVASGITISQLNGRINTISDLVHYKSGVLKGSLAQKALTEAGVSVNVYPSTKEGLKALAAGNITAFVGNEVSVRYLVSQDYPDRLQVEPLLSVHLRYRDALAVRPGFSRLHEINFALIQITSSPEWEREVDHWVPAASSRF